MNRNTGATKKGLLITGLSALAVIAIGLSAFAVLQNRSAPESGPGYVFEAEVTEPEPEPEAEVEPEPEETPVAEISLANQTRFLAAGSDGQYIRGEFGDCEATPGWAQVSVDGGLVWNGSRTEEQLALQLLGASFSEGAYVELAALDELCDPFLLRSYASGYDWQLAPGELSNRWFVNPMQAGVINSPLGPVDAPCDVVQLSVSENLVSAGVLCRDASIMLSYDDGQTWESVATIPGATSVAVRDYDVVVANTQLGECVGVQLQVIEDGSVENIGSCVGNLTDVEDVALAAFESELAVWAGDTFMRSVNGGQTWA